MECNEAYNRLEKADKSGKEDVAALTAAVGCLKVEVKGLRDEIGKTSNSLQTFNSRIGDTGNLLNDYSKSVYALGKNLREFATNQQAQYQLAEQLAESYKKVARGIGISTGRADDFSKEFKSATALVAQFGGDMNDVSEIYKGFADSSGRVRILNDTEVENIFKLGAAADLYGTKATELYETLDLMGVSNESATNRMLELVRDSEKIGLNSSKVIDVLASNMKSMQTYSFKGGVKGMTEMAKLGVKLRTDVSSMLGMAEKFYEPEAAIEAAANLQMLGGDIATAFGDPFETMYLARNKPEELAKKLQGMTENMMTFNEETGEYEFPAEVRMQLKSAGEQLGINTEQMIEMSRQTAKMKDVKDQLSMSSSFNEDEMEAIASMSRMEDGAFMVDVRDSDGKKVAKSIDELTKGDVSMLITTPQNEEEYMDEMLYEARTTNQRLEDLSKSGQLEIVAGVDVYKEMEKLTNDTLESLGGTLETSITTAISNLKESGVGGTIEGMFDKGSDFDTYMGNMISGIEKGLSGPLTLNDGGTLDINNSGKIIIRRTTNTSEDQIMDPGTRNTTPTGSVNNSTASNVTHTHNFNGSIKIESPDGSSFAINMDDPTIQKKMSEKIVDFMTGNFIDGVPGSTVNTS